MTNMYAKIQAKGQITLPASIRKQLHLKKGDVVIFEKIKGGVLIKPAELILSDALNAMGKELRDKGVDLEKWEELSEKGREELISDITEQETDAWVEIDQLAAEISAVWPKGVSAEEAIEDVRR